MLLLLPEAASYHQASPLLAHLPTLLDGPRQTTYIEWVIAENTHSTHVTLVPYFVNDITTYRVPSFSHLCSHLSLSRFDHAWVMFFAAHFCHDDASVVLDSNEIINAVLWALARAKRLRLASEKTSLEIADPIQLKARLRYSEEWALWALDAKLITQTEQTIAPEALDFMTHYAQLSLGGASSANPEAIRDLVQRALHPFVLRRLKEDVLPELPPKTVEEIILPMIPDQARLYQELQEVYRNAIAQHQAEHDRPTETEASFFLEGLMRLRQVAIHPQQLLSEQFQNCGSNKIDLPLRSHFQSLLIATIGSLFFR